MATLTLPRGCPQVSPWFKKGFASVFSRMPETAVLIGRCHITHINSRKHIWFWRYYLRKLRISKSKMSKRKNACRKSLRSVLPLLEKHEYGINTYKKTWNGNLVCLNPTPPQFSQAPGTLLTGTRYPPWSQANPTGHRQQEPWISDLSPGSSDGPVKFFRNGAKVPATRTWTLKKSRLGNPQNDPWTLNWSPLALRFPIESFWKGTGRHICDYSWTHPLPRFPLSRHRDSKY